MDSIKKNRVLVVEDNEIAQRIARILLQSLGCEFDIVGNGTAALELFSKQPYNLVLMDLGLPDITGFGATSEIRKIEKENSLPPALIVGLSVHAGELSRMRAIKAGMDDYIIKPLTREKCQMLLKRFACSNASDDRKASNSGLVYDYNE